MRFGRRLRSWRLGAGRARARIIARWHFRRRDYDFLSFFGLASVGVLGIFRENRSIFIQFFPVNLTSLLID